MDNDRRVRRTKREIKKAFLDLLKEKSIKEISIRELTEKSDVSRGTFYLHYEDIYNLLEEIENEIINDLNTILESHKPEDLKDDIYPLIKDLFNLVDENKELFKIFIENGINISFVSRVTDTLKTKCFYDWDSIFKSGKKENYEAYFSFIISGCIGLIQYWMTTDDQSVNEISLIAKELIISGTKIIK